MEALQRHGAPMTAQIYYIFLNGHAFPSFKLKLYCVNNSCLRLRISIPFASWPDSLNYRLNSLNYRLNCLNYRLSCLNYRLSCLNCRPDIGEEGREPETRLASG